MALAATTALALDGVDSPATLTAPGAAPRPPSAAAAMPARPPQTPFLNREQAARRGFDALKSGDVQNSVEALKYAADKGLPLAQWRLGKMYADGEGVPHDDLRAYQYFAQIVDNYDEDANRRDLSVVSNAFVAVGVYALNGISGGKLKPDAFRALEMFQFAATNFGNPDAQYNLARMYLDGAGVHKNVGQAVRWLGLAAEKNHVLSQGLLGHLLFAGQGGVARQRARGLMWLTLARDGADPAKDSWIVDSYARAMSAASDVDREAARVYLEAFLKRRE